MIRLSGMSTRLQIKGSLVRFPVGAHAQAMSPVGGGWEATTQGCFSLSLSLSLETKSFFKKSIKNVSPWKHVILWVLLDLFLFVFNTLFIYFWRWEEREKERERNMGVWEKHQLVLVTSHTPPTRGLPHNLGICPDQESNQWPFGLWDNAQPIEPHQSGLNCYFFREMTMTNSDWHILCPLEIQLSLPMASLYTLLCNWKENMKMP